MNANNRLDPIDKKILEILQKNGRITNSELARRVGISPPPTLERVRKLERKGIIRKYVALIDPDAAGKGTVAFVAISLDRHLIKSIDRFTRAIERFPEVMECYHISGQEDYILKVAVKNIHEYERFILERLTKIPAVSKIQTSFVLSTVKFETNYPVE